MFLAFFFLMQFGTISLHGVCVSRTLYATLTKSYASVLRYGNNDDCTYTVRPSLLLSSGYYLEIKWLSFQVEGNMPTCKDYVEVKLTRSSYSIGKFCSDNIGSSSLFDMYSADGYATIRFKSDASVTRGGIRFSYQLKSRWSSYLGDYRSRICRYSPARIGRSLIFYSSGWPRSYSGAVGSLCSLWLDVGSSSATKIVLMDVNLRGLASTTCSTSNDYLEIKHSSNLYTTASSIRTYPTTISGKLCRTISSRSYIATKRYVYIYFNNRLGSLLSRGFMAGYIAYMVSPSSPVLSRRRRLVVPTRRRLVVPTRRRVVVPTRRRVVVPTRRRLVVPTRRRVVVPTRRRVVVPTRRRLVVPTRRRLVVPTRRRLVVPTRRRVVVPTRRRLVDTTRRRIILSRRRSMVRRRTSSTKEQQGKPKKLPAIIGGSVGSFVLIAIGLVIVVVERYLHVCKPAQPANAATENANQNNLPMHSIQS